MYGRIIEKIFLRHYRKGSPEFGFGRQEIIDTANELHSSGQTGQFQPKNVGDVIYTFRHRRPLPPAVRATHQDFDQETFRDGGWMILGAGHAQYRFRMSKLTHIRPTAGLPVIKLPNATPEIISTYALNDEQALLAKMRYNRLIDIFLGVTAYSMQNHLRTFVENYGQIEIDELYVGVGREGSQCVIPVQAKGDSKSDILGAIQTIQDVMFCRTPLTKKTKRRKKDYSELDVRAVSAKSFKFDGRDAIAMFWLDFDGKEVIRKRERHYMLVGKDEISPEELKRYRTMASEDYSD